MVFMKDDINYVIFLRRDSFFSLKKPSRKLIQDGLACLKFYNKKVVA